MPYSDMAMLMDVLDVFARKYPVNTTINKGSRGFVLRYADV